MSKMPNIRLTSVEDLFKTDEERQTDKLEKVQIVPAELVHPYPREPYQVDRATADLVQLMDSIQRVGKVWRIKDAQGLRMPVPRIGREIDRFGRSGKQNVSQLSQIRPEQVKKPEEFNDREGQGQPQMEGG